MHTTDKNSEGTVPSYPSTLAEHWSGKALLHVSRTSVRVSHHQVMYTLILDPLFPTYDGKQYRHTLELVSIQLHSSVQMF